MRDTELSTRLLKEKKKKKHCSLFSAYSEVEVLGKVLVQMLVCTVQISRLDSKSKFQMFTPFSGSHVGVPRKYIRIRRLHAGLGKFVRKISTNI